jgi:hypothetical protein
MGLRPGERRLVCRDIRLPRQTLKGQSMALIPDPSWSIPADKWDDVVARYVKFRRVKAWRGRTHATGRNAQSQQAYRLRRANSTTTLITSN